MNSRKTQIHEAGGGPRCLPELTSAGLPPCGISADPQDEPGLGGIGGLTVRLADSTVGDSRVGGRLTLVVTLHRFPWNSVLAHSLVGLWPVPWVVRTSLWGGRGAREMARVGAHQRWP